MPNKHYAEAIDALEKIQQLDCARIILVEIAKLHPSAVVKAYEKLHKRLWLKDVIDLLKSKKKIDAIKLYREKTGVGLKEAKVAVDALEVN
jgi:ribosomal protein L7/L12